MNKNINSLLTKNVLKLFLSISIPCIAIFSVIDYLIYGENIGYVLVFFTFILITLHLLLHNNLITVITCAYVASFLSLFFAIPFSIYFSGGLFSPIVSWYIIIPIGSLLLFGSSVKTYFFIGISIFFVMGFAVLEMNGYQFPPTNTSYLAVGALLDFIGLIILVFLFTRIFEAQKKIAYQSLEKEKEVFKKHTEQLPGMIYQSQYFLDGTYKYLFLSEGAKDVFQIEDLEAAKNDVSILLSKVYPDDIIVINNSFKKSAITLQNAKYSVRLKLSDTEIKWVSGSAKPERQKDGSTIWYGHAYDITDEKLAAEKLLQSQDSVNLITNIINDVFYLYDFVNKKYLFISPNCKNILGVEDSFFYEGNSFTETVMYEEDRNLVKNANKIVADGKEYNIDFRAVVDGKIRWLNEKCNPIKDKNGKTIQNTGIISDITERKLAEEKFSESQNNILQITSTINDIFFLYDCIEKKYLFISPSCDKVLGVTDSFFYDGKSYTDNYAHPNDKAKLNNAYNRIGEVGEYELAYRSIIGGKEKWLNEKSFAIKNEKGTVQKISGVITDITERKRTEEKLIQSQKSFEEAQELANIGSWEVSFFDLELKWSKELYRIFEMENTPVDKIAEGFRSKVHPKDLMQVEEKISLLIKNGDVDSCDFRVLAKNGEIKYISAIAETIKSTNTKKVIGVRGAAQDVTKQKLAELAKSNFLSTMSHEIRTPINGVIGITNLLMDEQLTPIQKEYVDTLSFSAQHLSTIVSDILDFSKIESGSLTFEKLPFNLEEVCKNIFNLFKPKSIEKNIEYIYKANIENFFLLGDYVRLSQVLSNLLVNAIKFTKVGNVTFSYEKLEENNKAVVIQFIISDTGIGITQMQQKRIFDSFLQGDDSVTRQYGGTGLGLTISKKLIELQHGKISVDSIHGKGSTFKVALSFEKNSFHVSEVLSIIGKTEKIATLKNMKILVAEDNKVNSLVLTRFLTKWGVESKVVTDGKKAIDLLMEEQFDLILMDLQMPILDGRAATKLIRLSENKKLQSIPIIALTADALVESQRELLKTGFNDCVTKPFNPAVLFKLLEGYYFQKMESNIV